MELTENQKSIIDSLTEEFININNSNKLINSENNPLLRYANEALSLKNEEILHKNNILTINKTILYKRCERAEQDFKFIKKMMEEINIPELIVKLDSNKRNITFYKNQGVYLNINYPIIARGETSYMYEKNIEIYSDEQIIQHTNGKKFKNINDLINSEEFSKEFINYVNR